MKFLREMVTDETGAASTARTSFLFALVSGVSLAIADAVSTSVTVSEPAYAFLGAVVGIAGVWAAGPRIAEYVGPALGQMVQGIGMARRSPERPDPDAETMVDR